ncbi:MAG TPA: GTPase Era [Caulobacterales bacterium]|nr:GTPase Era [Caulobacterales bacterium]
MSEATFCAVVAIIGAPNAGKSTLVNRLVGEKVSIVTHKAQTTRAAVRGVAMRGAAQLVLVDTPGVFAPKRRLDRAMVRAAWTGASDADVIVHLVDAHTARGLDDAIRTRLIEEKRKVVLAFNKVDLVEKPVLLALTQTYTADGPYTDVFMISANSGKGVDDLADHLADRAPVGPWLFPEDQASDAPARILAAEITREKLMLRLHDELPYDATVETESWQEHKDGSVRIDQTIYVARDSQKKIAIGEGGQVVKAIGAAARKELEHALDRRVHLFLNVKVRENWAEERARYEAIGLEWEN